MQLGSCKIDDMDNNSAYFQVCLLYFLELLVKASTGPEVSVKMMVAPSQVELKVVMTENILIIKNKLNIDLADPAIMNMIMKIA